MKLLELLLVVISSHYCVGVDYANYEYIQDDNAKAAKTADGLRRPCVLTNVNCISRILGENRLCNPALDTDTLFIYIPHANATLIRRSAQIVGLNNYKIKEFYINDATSKMVLVVDFPAVTAYTDKPEFIFHIRGKESVVTSDYALITYRDLSLTLTAANAQQNKLTDGHVFTYINDVHPPLSLGPRLVPRDTDALKNFNKILEDMPMTLREMFVTQGPDFMYRFLQTVICEYQAR